MDLFSEKTILSVSRLTALLRGVLEENFEHVWVQGEISNLSQPSSGHLYFSLKDAGAQLRCVMFKATARNLRFRPADGMALIARGRVTVYDQRGDYQLICEYIEPAGIGALQAAFEQLKTRLSHEGLFAQERKRAMPLFPRRIGVVTSSTGAAIHDILTVLRRRFASLEVILYPVRVQGEGAAQEIATAIADLNRLKAADVLIVGRGGGALEDLWPFNEEITARAIYRSVIPVISAVGHETDWTISDFVADLRAPTPSAAAELVIASSAELRAQVESLEHRLRAAMESRTSALRSRVDLLRRSLHDPCTLLGHMTQRIDDLSERLDLALLNALARRREQFDRLESTLLHHTPVRQIDLLRQRLNLLSSQAERLMAHRLHGLSHCFAAAAARLEVLSPLNTLSRGYAIATRRSDDRVVTDAESLSCGELLRLRLHAGSAIVRVEEQEPVPLK